MEYLKLSTFKKIVFLIVSAPIFATAAGGDGSQGGQGSGGQPTRIIYDLVCDSQLTSDGQYQLLVFKTDGPRVNRFVRMYKKNQKDCTQLSGFNESLIAIGDFRNPTEIHFISDDVGDIPGLNGDRGWDLSLNIGKKLGSGPWKGRFAGTLSTRSAVNTNQTIYNFYCRNDVAPPERATCETDRDNK